MIVDQVGNLSAAKETVLLQGLLFLQTDSPFESGYSGWFCSVLKLFLRWVPQNLGPWGPLIEREDLRSSTDWTTSTSLIHIKASLGNCEQVHTSVLNLIFQQGIVAGLGNWSKWRSENPQSLLVGSIILWKSSPLRVEWISGWRSWLASGIHSCVWCLTSTRYMRWCVFRYVGNSKDGIFLDQGLKRRLWIYRHAMRIPNIWRLIIAA